MEIVSLQPYDDIYQVVDEDGSVLYQGKQVDCLIYKTFKTENDE